jgi:hypothetical protein
LCGNQGRFFKYKINLTDNSNGGIYRTIKGYRENNPFFSKPHTGIEGLVGHKKTITVGRLNEVHDVVDQRKFDIIIWNFKVTNKHQEIAQTAINCYVIINWDFIQTECQLLWKTLEEEPNVCNIPISPTQVQAPTPHSETRYEGVLGDDYTVKLKHIGQPLMTIPQGKSRFLYFLLTIKGHDLAYPIMKISTGMNYCWTRNIIIPHIHGIPLFSDFEKYHDFSIGFQSDRCREVETICIVFT